MKFNAPRLLRFFPLCLAMFAGASDLNRILLAAEANSAAAVAADLESGWNSPPRESRLRAYWWWLNGNVTKAAISRDLEEMKAKGWGGALICDAGGATQDGNDPVPHGPDFFSPPWRELYRHALREADRLGLELSLNIQSGWNLGGPMVAAEDAAKKLVWTETRITGPAKFTQRLAQPPVRDNFYRDLFVVGYRLTPRAAHDRQVEIQARSEQAENPAANAVDGSEETYWVSAGGQAGQGPTRERPQWLQLTFAAAIRAERLKLVARSGYGPRECELQASDDGKSFRPITKFTAESRGAEARFTATTGRVFRVVFFGAFDPRYPAKPRNVQIAELQLSGSDGTWPAGARRRPIQNWQEKALHKPLHFSAPDTTPLLNDVPSQADEADSRSADVQDLTARLATDGTLRWDVPDGTWEVIRFGCTIGNHSSVSTSSDGWKGYALDVLDPGALRRYWDAVVEPLIADAGPLAGKTLKYLHTDSWEIEVVNWTPSLREEFRRRRGYDLLPFLPAVAGRIVDSRPVSNRFLHDFRKTIGDLAIDHHYQLFRDGAHKHGMQIHPESGGPHAVPIDAQRCLGFNDVPMSEFWARSWRHRIGDTNRFFVKQPASAAHAYGRKLVAAEGFTTIGPHWQETLWDNLKPSFDHACAEGLNLLVWHAFVCSPQEAGMPGQQYFAGTHMNPNTTWWAKSAAFTAYINRCQWMLQQGRFAADVACYYGDHVPNFAQLKASDPARVQPGYDHDVVTEEVILTRMSVRDGRLVLPDGMSYRLLVLPERSAISLAVLRKLKELVAAGATVIGPKPASASGLSDYPQCDAEVARLAAELWGEQEAKGPGQRAVGKGRVCFGSTAREVLLADGVGPDFEFQGKKDTALDWIHRRDGETEIYFIANRSGGWEDVRCTFRVAGKAPELWDPVRGEHHFAAAYWPADRGARGPRANPPDSSTDRGARGPRANPPDLPGRTTVPLDLPPYGSVFVVFRADAAAHPPRAEDNSPRVRLQLVDELAGPWTVRFDPQWGGPESVVFEKLVDWTKRPEEGIRHYSGTATYRKTFPFPAQPGGPSKTFLDLGELHELAEVRINGRSLGTVWAAPFRVEVTDALRAGENSLEIDVVNFWPNRLIGDASLPAQQRRTKTNVRKLTADTPLMPSGLLGPVRICGLRPDK